MIKESSQLKIGDKIEISRMGSKTIKHKSQILDILNEKEYIISGPISRSTIVNIRLNTILEISYNKEEKGKFVFKALVTDKNEKGVYKLKIERLSDITRIQERNFFRLPLSLEINKKFKVTEGNKEITMEEICKTTDISGGGTRIFSNFNHKKNDKLLLTLYIDNKEINILGEVVRTSESSNNSYHYEVAVKFVDIDNTDRDIIVKYIFDQQRELRKKGLI